IAKVDEVLVGERDQALVEDGQPAHARVEHPHRPRIHQAIVRRPPVGDPALPLLGPALYARGVSAVRIGICSFADEGLLKRWYPPSVRTPAQRLAYYA
ncbi:MAG: hypothetical protein C4307_03340, partial [Chloroflexota bacterium]